MVSKFSDVAVGLSADKLGFRDYAEGVIATLESLSKEDTPFTIGIFGSWGSGKTSFMQIMQELLESRGYETIFFNSWEYGNEEKLWIPFMIKVVDELFEDGVVKKDLIRNVALFSTDVVLQTGTQGRVSTGAISNLIDRSRKNRVFKNWLDNDTKTVIERVTKIEEFKKRIKERAEGSYLFSIDTPVLEKLFSHCKLSIRAIAKRCRKVNFYHINKYKEDLDNDVIPKKLKREFKANELSKAKENFEKHPKTFKYSPKVHKERSRSDNALKEKDKWVIPYGDGIYIVKKEDDKIKIYEKSKKGKIIIFIDDLDRIPEKMVDFLNSLKTFLDIKGCIFVLGCDYKILDSALKQMYKEEKEEKEGIYKDYFDKIVQTEFYIPKISEQAIKNYLSFLTGWDDKEIEECTLLVIHSIGGNPRKIKRVVNATMLIKSVFEKKLATFLQAFERPKLREMYLFSWDNVPGNDSERLLIFLLDDLDIDWAENAEIRKSDDGKIICIFKDENSAEIMIDEEKEKATLKIGDGKIIDLKVKKENGKEFSRIFTPAEVFDLLFDKKVLFKLVCMREQWPIFYEDILSEEKKQDVLISLQDSDFTTGMSKLLGTAKEIVISELLSATKEQGDKVKKHLENFSIFLNDYPIFHGVEDLKTYLILLEISSPEAGISLEYPEPAKLPIHLFNRYMLFERINKGKVEERIIEKKINQMDWKNSLGAYNFFIRVIRAFGYDNLLRDLFEKYQVQIAERITASTNPHSIGWLLFSVIRIDKRTARGILNKTSDTYAGKISASTDPEAIGALLYAVKQIEEETARGILNQTKDSIADKIRDSSDLGAIGGLLSSVSWIDKETARGILNKTSDTYAGKINASTDPEAIGGLLSSVSRIEEETARGILNKTSDTYAGKISASTDPEAIGALLYAVRQIEEETARGILDQTKDPITDKIRDSSDLGAIGGLLSSVIRIEEETARGILNKTSDTYADKIRDSSDLGAIKWLLDRVSGIEEETARVLLNQTKDSIADKIRASTDLWAIRVLLNCVSGIEEETARVLLNQTKDSIADKIRTSTDPRAIIGLLNCVSGIDKETARVLLNQTKDSIADKIRASTNLGEIEWLLGRVRGIEEETARGILNQTKDSIADKIRANTDLGAIGRLLGRVSGIDNEIARGILNQTKDSIAEKIRASTVPLPKIWLLKSVRKIDPKTAEWLEKET
jgi:hypothetical protein